MHIVNTTNYKFLLKFILDLIERIIYNPSSVKWALDLISIDAYLKYLKYSPFTPFIGYSSKKKGIILSIISEEFVTTKFTIPNFSAIEKNHNQKLVLGFLINSHHGCFMLHKNLI